MKGQVQTLVLLRGTFCIHHDDRCEEEEEEEQLPRWVVLLDYVHGKSNNKQEENDSQGKKPFLPVGLPQPVDNYHRNEQVEDEDKRWLQRLQDACPLATQSECQRFYHASTKSGTGHTATSGAQAVALAEQNLKAYLTWRQLYTTTTTSTATTTTSTATITTTAATTRDQDRADWDRAWDVTWNRVQQMNANDNNHGDTINFFFPSVTPPSTTVDHKTRKRNTAKLKPTSKLQRKPIPQYIFAHHNNHNNHTITANSASLILQILPAQIDLQLRQPNHDQNASMSMDDWIALHTLAVALYLDSKFNNDSRQQQLQQADLLLDVRGAPGWPNPTPWQLIPLIQTMAQCLIPLFPERLHHLIVYPLPAWAVLIYKAIHRLLPSYVTQRTRLIAGSDRHHVKQPNMEEAQLIKQVSAMTEELLHEINQTRQEQAQHALAQNKHWE